MKRYFLTIIVMVMALSSHAQDFLGLKIGNYAGVHGLAINPAINVNGPKQIDINFLTFGMSFESNYIYLEKSNILLAGLKMGRLRPNPAIKMDRSKISKPLYYNYFDRDGKYHFYGNGFVQLPSGIVNVRNHSFGFSFTNKFLGYANRISKDYGYYLYADSATTEMWLDPMKVGLLHYGELALNYATQLPSSGVMDVNFGITAKYILPWDALFLRNNVTKESIKIDNGVKIPEGSDVDFNWASSYHYDYENDKPVYKMRRKGDGVALDLGVTFVNSLSDGEQVHKWKFGVAIIDIGKVFIRDGEVNAFKTIDTAILRDEYYEGVKDLKAFREVSNYHSFNGDESHTVVGNTFSAWMPMALSVFGDYNVRNNFYLSLHSILRVPMKAIGLEKSNTIAITPRIEKEKFEVAFPVILHEFKSPRAGFFIRKGVFFAGSDNMTAWIIPQRLSGMEFYMGFKWSGELSYKTKRANLRRLTVKCPVW